MVYKPIKKIERGKDGEIIINPGSTAANDDWIRAARLSKEGKIKEFEEMDNTQMYVDIEEE